MTITDTDQLPPTQYLVMEVLAARHRLGEHAWTFPARLGHQLDALSQAGLIGVGGVVARTRLAWLTEAGKEAATDPGYVPPILRSGEAS